MVRRAGASLRLGFRLDRDSDSRVAPGRSAAGFRRVWRPRHRC